MSPSGQIMAANVALAVTFQFLSYFRAQVAIKNRCLSLFLFYGVLNSLYVILGTVFLGVAETNR